MSKNALMEELEYQQIKKEVPHFEVGDTVKVTLKIREGDKERTQVFQGTVISRKGSGLSETFNVHRIAFGMGMERIFLLHSPRIEKLEVVKEGRVRRAKLYYLRGTQGKKAKVAGREVARKKRAPQVAKVPASLMAGKKEEATTKSAEVKASESAAESTEEKSEGATE